MNGLWRFIKGRLYSFVYAMRGIILAIQKEHSMWLHCGFAILTLLVAYLFKVSTYEWIAIILCIGMVIVSEIMNTAIEYIVDFISPEYSKQAGNIKDLAAGAVLLASIAAACVGLIIFVPKILDCFNL